MGNDLLNNRSFSAQSMGSSGFVSLKATGTTYAEAFRIRCIGDSGTYTSPEPLYVGTSTHAWTFYTASGVADTSIGTAGVITLIDGMTAAQFAALVNASQNWRVVLTGALPEDVLYTTSGTANYLNALPTSTNSLACNTGKGTIVYFPLFLAASVTQGFSSLSAGLVSLANFSDVLGAIEDPTTILSYRDIASYPTGQGAVSPMRVAAFLRKATVTADYGIGTTLSGYVRLYASTQFASRLLTPATAIAAAATPQTTNTDFTSGDPLIVKPGERIVVRVGNWSSEVVLNPQIDLQFGVGEWCDGGGY
jgi:hypothetical protein